METLRAAGPTPIARIVRPFQEFAHNKAAGGVVLLLCAVTALVWANSPWAGSYEALWHHKFAIGPEGATIDRDLHFWVNDALMAIFFFVVGLEIKREILIGELASFRQAALPIAAALGGVMVPAGIYAALNSGGPGAPGWGIPMATDIAFALGVLALLGERAPLGLKVFLTALAIVDDIAAVLVIAVFYTASISTMWLLAAAVLVGLLFGANRLGVRRPLPYVILGAALWVAVLNSGIHATIAGVALAFTIPAQIPLRPRDFLSISRSLVQQYEAAAAREKCVDADEEQQAVIEAMEDACEQAQAPLHRIEYALHPWVTFAIMPLFALANAGVTLSGGFAAGDRITLGIVMGLVLGKPLGIMGASWLAVRSGMAALPNGVTWRHIHGAGWLGGIGFTMSLFVAMLAFADASLLATAKVGILTASTVAAIVGSVLVARAGRRSGPDLR
jgi:Na+:H+ antiporter, NhaA family